MSDIKATWASQLSMLSNRSTLCMPYWCPR